MPENLDELFQQMDLEELSDATHVTPREYAKMRNMSPQLVYYYIRTGKVKDERCMCGRRVISISATDEALQAAKGSRGRIVDPRSDAARSGTEAQGSVLQEVLEDSSVEATGLHLRAAGHGPDPDLVVRVRSGVA